jgi:hypothetical protein
VSEQDKAQNAKCCARVKTETFKKMTPNGYKCYFMRGLIVMMVLSACVVSGEGKLIFCRACRSTRGIIHNHQATTEPNESTSVHTAHIINAPSKCKPGMVLDKRNICRKLVFNN